MTRIIAALAASAVALHLMAAPASAVQDCEINGQAVNPANGATTAGKSGIMRCRDRDSGIVLREEELRDGRFIGLVRHYRDGNPSAEFSINDQGNREGLYREFLPDGAVVREEMYRNGSAVGLGRSWYASGSFKRVVFRGEDGRELASVEYSPRNQLKDLRCADRPLLGAAADDARLCGHGATEPTISTLYGDNGAIRSRVGYHHGVRVTQELFWDNGKLREQENPVEGGMIQRSYTREGIVLREVHWRTQERGRIKEVEREFHPNGALQRETRWEAGIIASEETFYMNGQPKSRRTCSPEGNSRICQTGDFHDNGKLARQGRFLIRKSLPDLPLGLQRTFDREGFLLTEREHDTAGRLTREKEFDRSGAVLRDDEVFEDGSRKAFSAPR